MKFKYLLFLLGILLAVPVLALITLAFTLPITISGIGYLLASSLIIAGLLLAPWMRRHSLLIAAGALALLLIAGTRIIQGKRNSATNLYMITLPQGKETRWLGLILDEQDSLIFGEALFHVVGGSSAGEHAGITESLYQDYSEMRQAHGVVPSPILNTYLNLQNPNAFDAVILKPEVNRHPEVGVIFLHGYMGNVTAQCWEIAQAVNRFGAVTVCPSTEWIGIWWQPQGEQILRSTFNYLREQGISKIYLGGFSNGGFGIGRLVPTLRDEEDLSGLIFIDGITAGADIRSLNLPVLIIEGTQDEQVPASEVRQIAELIGDKATYIEINSDHFLIMKQPDMVQTAIVNWLEELEFKK